MAALAAAAKKEQRQELALTLQEFTGGMHSIDIIKALEMKDDNLAVAAGAIFR